MKINKLLIVAISAVVVIAGCSTKKKNDLLTAKWHVTDISGKETEALSDSMKKEMFKDASIEFKKDGKYETIGMGGGTKTGTWKFGDDEKTLITTEDGSSYVDTVHIVDLSAGKLVVQDSKGDLKISFKSH